MCRCGSLTYQGPDEPDCFLVEVIRALFTTALIVFEDVDR